MMIFVYQMVLPSDMLGKPRKDLEDHFQSLTPVITLFGQKSVEQQLISAFQTKVLSDYPELQMEF